MTPKHVEVLLLDDLRRHHRMVVGLHPMPDFENLLLNIAQFAGGQSFWRQYLLSLILRDADENVVAAEAVARRLRDG